MEISDLATEIEQQTTAAAIAAAKLKAANTKKLLYTGSCYYCGEKVPSPRAFCDGQCRDDWQYEQDRRKANGLG